MNEQKLPWAYNSAAHRWYGFGRYYAMFPPSFAYGAIRGLTCPGQSILDPFCGRGNGPFTGIVLGRHSFGIDINPVAWIFASVKLMPEKEPNRLFHRMKEVARAQRIQDRQGQNRFERMAWAPAVRAFLRAARRELDWKNSVTDRTLMAFIALHMQDKLGAGLSNSLWPTIACSPQYAVAWWTKKGLLRPPDVDPVAVLTDKIQRRYRYGIPGPATGSVMLSDARDALRIQTKMNANLLITSPPYIGVTDYWNDHWIRLWLLGHAMRNNWKRSARYGNREAYRGLIQDVFRESRGHLDSDAAILVRSDRRRQTAEACLEAMQETWPRRRIFIRTSDAPHDGVSVHHGRGGSKAKEVDFLIPGARGDSWGRNCGFRPIEQEANQSIEVW